MFFRKQHWHLVSEWTLCLLNALKYLWCETNLLSQAVLKHVVSEDYIFKKSVQETDFVSSQEWRNLSYQKNFICFKMKTSTFGLQVGHMWVTSGLLCGSVGQMGQQVWPTFNPEQDYPRSFDTHGSKAIILKSNKKSICHNYIWHSILLLFYARSSYKITNIF